MTEETVLSGSTQFVIILSVPFRHQWASSKFGEKDLKAPYSSKIDILLSKKGLIN